MQTVRYMRNSKKYGILALQLIFGMCVLHLCGNFVYKTAAASNSQVIAAHTLLNDSDELLDIAAICENTPRIPVAYITEKVQNSGKTISFHRYTQHNYGKKIYSNLLQGFLAKAQLVSRIDTIDYYIYALRRIVI